MLLLTHEVLEDLCSIQPGPEARQAVAPNLLSALIGDHVTVFLHDHQFGNGCDLVALLQLTKKRRKK